MRRALLVGLLFGRAVASAQSQPQTPTFRTTVEYVEVDARVADDKGNPIRDLSKGDFRLFEDGQEQTIDSFAAIDIPIESSNRTASAATTTDRRVEPDASSNDRAPDKSRVFVLVLDDRQIDASRTPNTIKIATTFIERNMGSNDLAAIVLTSGRTDISQTLTGNKTQLLNAVSKFVGRKIEPRSIASFNGVVGDLGWSFEGLSAFQAIRSVVDWMAEMRGRTKVLLFVSEGWAADDSFSLLDPNPGWFFDAERETVAAATRGNVTINTIDPRGLYGYEELTSVGPTGARAVSGGRQSDAAVGSQLSALYQAFRQEVGREQMSMRSLADLTGGISAINTNNFQAVLDQIVIDHSTYYLLGYYPKNPRRDGRTRQLSVRVNRRGARVEARRSYLEPKGPAATAGSSNAGNASGATGTGAGAAGSAAGAAAPGPSNASPAMREALNTPTPMQGVPLVATAAAFRGSSADRATIAVIVETPSGGTLAETAPAGTATAAAPGSVRFTGAVELTTIAVDARNAMAASESGTVNLQFGREAADRFARLGFRNVTKLENLRPGRYQVRAAIGLPGSTPGSVWYDVEVPDFSKDAVTMSGVVLSSMEGAGVPTSNARKLFEGDLTGAPTAARRFKSGDEITAFAEIYFNRSDLSASRVTVRIKDAAEKVSFERQETVSTASLGTGNVFKSRTSIPLVDLDPGDYVLSIEASADDRTPASRSVPFSVR
jgi:VWFA-related protein